MKGQTTVGLNDKTFKARHSRGQAAVEYITTYGWAILLLVIVVAAIFASGVLTPSYFISEECYLGPNIACNFLIYKESGSFQTNIALNITNGFPYKIYLTEFKISPSDDETIISEPIPSMTLISGGSVFVPITIDQKSSANTMKKFKVNIKYISCAAEVNEKCEQKTELEHEISGRIIGRVNEKT